MSFKKLLFTLSMLGAILVAFNSCSDDDDPKSQDAQITKFTFNDLSPIVEATIDETAKTITATVADDVDITKLTPTIEIKGAYVSPDSKQEQDFSAPVQYTVTAESGHTEIYTVTVTALKKEVSVVGKWNISKITANVEGNNAEINKALKANIETAKLSSSITESLGEVIEGIDELFPNGMIDFIKTISLEFNADNTFEATVKLPEAMLDNVTVVAKGEYSGIEGKLSVKKLTDLDLGDRLNGILPVQELVKLANGLIGSFSINLADGEKSKFFDGSLDITDMYQEQSAIEGIIKDSDIKDVDPKNVEISKVLVTVKCTPMK